MTKASTRLLGALALTLCARTASGEPPPSPTKDELDRQFKKLHERPHRRYLLPIAENLIAIGGGFTWYWIDRERQVADWDFPTIADRLTFKEWRYDANPFPINFAWHAFDGGQYHMFARANDLDLLTTMAIGLGTSVLWEFFVEYREKVSINDVLFTTATGTVIGEYINVMGRYFESAPQRRWWHPIPRVLLTTSRTGHNAIFGYDRTRYGVAADHLGFSSDIWHRFTLATGVAHARFDGDVDPERAGAGPTHRPTLGRVLIAGDLAMLPGYLTAPELDRSFFNANITSARVRMDGGVGSFALDFGVDTFMLGHHRQRFSDGKQGDAGNGTASTLGVDLAVRYRRELLGLYVQRLAQTHLPGLAFDHHLRMADGDATLHAKVRANYDFVGVHALAYRTWREMQVGDVFENNVVRKHKYYFGWGPSTRLSLELEAPSVATGASLGLASYHSARGLDRKQEELTIDLDIRDKLVDWDAWVRVGTPQRRTFVEARVEQHRRTNSVEDVTEKTRLTTFLMMFGTEQ